MEKQLYKVYSNNSKKRRLKRNKKFIRVWDSKTNTYVKVKKVKTRVSMTSKEYKEYWKNADNITSTKQAEPTVVQPEPENVNIKTTKKQPKKQKRQPSDTIRETLQGRVLEWSKEARRYKFVA